MAVALAAGTVPVWAAPAAATPTEAQAVTPAEAPATDDCVAQPDEARAMAAARACGAPVENLAARTETQEAAANPDGTWTAKIYAGQVRMRNSKNDLVVVDPTLVAAADGSVAPVAHPAGLKLSGPVENGVHELLSLDVGGKRVALSWAGKLSAPVLDRNQATYRGVRPGVDLVVRANRSGVEQFLIVKNRAAADQVASVKVPIKAAGLTVDKDGDGGLVFKDKTGAVVGTSPTPEMWDSSIDPATGGPKRVVQVDATQTFPAAGRATVALRPDKDFFADPATVYPVTVDPQINPLGVAFDTYVKENESVDRSGANDLQVGLTSGNRSRAFVQWDTSGLVGRQVNSATIHLYNWFSQSCTAAQWEVWTTGAASSASRWGNQPAWLHKEVASTATKGHNSSCRDGWVSVDGTSLMKRAVNADQSRAHMGLRATDETSIDSIGFKQFRSSQPAEPDQQGQEPYAVVNYNSHPNALDPLKLQPGDAAETGTRTPTMKAVFSDPDGGTGRVDYEVYDRTGATLKTSGSGNTVSNGSESTWVVMGASRGEQGILGEGIRQALLRDPTYGPALNAAAAMLGS